MNPTRTKICSLMARKRLTVEDVLTEMDPDWADHFLYADIAFDFYMKYSGQDFLEAVRKI